MKHEALAALSFFPFYPGTVTALQTSSLPHGQQEWAADARSYFLVQELLHFINASRLPGTAITKKCKTADNKRSLLGVLFC